MFNNITIPSVADIYLQQYLQPDLQHIQLIDLQYIKQSVLQRCR